MGVTSGQGLQAGTGINPNPEGPTQSYTSEEQPPNNGRSTQAAVEGSNKNGDALPEPVSQQDICCPEEGWVTQTSDQLEAIEPVYDGDTFQDGEPEYDEGLAETGQLDGLNRPQGRIPFSFGLGRPPKVPPLYVAGDHIRVPVSSLRTMQCPPSFYKAPEASASSATSSRCTDYNVPGRHVDHVPVEGRIREATEPDHSLPGRTRLCDQQEEITPAAYPVNSVLGLCGRLQGDVNQTHRGEGGPDICNMQEGTTSRITISSPAGQANRQDDSNHTSNTSSPTLVPRPTTAEESNTTSIPVIRNNSNHEPGSSPRSGLVVHQDKFTDREEDPVTGTRHDHRNGCFDAGMGSSLYRCEDRWPLVTGREQESHKLPGAPGSHLCGKVLRQVHKECSHSDKDGQQNSHLLCESNGRDSLPEAEQPSDSAVAMVFREEFNPGSRTPSRNRQLHSRRGIQDHPLNSRMETTTGNFPAPHADFWHVRRGPLCHTPKYPVREIRELETRPRGDRSRCSAVDLDQLEGICLPPILPDREMPQKSKRGQGIAGTCSTSVEVPAMVPSSAGASDRLSLDPTCRPSASDRPLRQAPSTDCDRTAPTSRLEAIRRRQTAEGISEETSQLLAAGWSRGTNVAYQSAWKRWVGWCTERKVDPFSCTVKYFLEFLTSLYKEGLQYRTINTIRSAVSTTHDHIEGVPIGKHPLVSRLFRGIHNLRPPQPRYVTTWDVDTVVQHLKSMGQNDSLALKQLTQKLALLMALVEASRVSELQALDLRYRLYRPERVVFQLPTLGKKRVVGAPPKEVMFGAFPQDSRLCVVQCLRQYEKATAQYRKMEPSSPQPLFLSYIKPHDPVSSQRIAHWLKDVLGRAGVDTNIFKAHSVRGASSTAASEKGVHIKDILRTADWSTDSTFRRFYYRPSHENGYAQTLLQPRNKR